MTIGEHEVVKNHLLYLVKNRTEDNLIPRLLYYENYEWRIVRKTLFRKLNFPELSADQIAKRSVKISVLGEHHTAAVDSNLLVIHGLMRLSQVDKSFNLADHKQEIIELFDFYDTRLKEGLIKQPAYGDWQDSVKRDDRTSYVSILYWKVMNELHALGWIEDDPKKLQAIIMETFFDEKAGIMRTMPGRDQYSLDSNLLAIEFGFFDKDNAKLVYEEIKKTQLWNSGGLPGMCTFPDYEYNEKSYSTKTVGLENYHDSMNWSWLLGKSLLVASMMGDKEEIKSVVTLYWKV